MKFLTKSILLIFLGTIFLIIVYGINLFSSKPFSLDHYLTKYLIISLSKSPEYLTYVGAVDFLNPITKHNGKLSNDSIDDIRKNYLDNKKHLNILENFDDNKISADQKVTKEIALFDVKNEIKAHEQFKYHSYPINQIGGFHLNLIEFITDLHPVRNRREAYDYVKRVNEIESVIDNQILWMVEQAKAGIFLPTFVFENVIRQLNEIISNQGAPLKDTFQRKIDDLGIQSEEKDKLKSSLQKAINDGFIPSYKKLLNYMMATKQYANKNHGVWSLPNGDEFYKLRIRVYTTTDYSPQKIHDIGISEVSRISNRLSEIFNELNYDPEKTAGTLLNELNEDPNFLYPDTPDRKSIVIADYNKMVKEAEEGIKSYFARMPKSDVIVKAVPEYSEENAAGGYYMPPSLDGKRPGVFYANLYDIKQTPTYSMRTLTFHEALPGHHLQNALNIENEELSFYRRYGYGTSAFGEGWALYSEQLALEAGLATDPYDEIGILQSELFRAVRLVVDTGIHYKKWTREEAMNYMKEKTGMSDTEVRSEIERYIVWPAQALSYKVGMLKVLELRQLAMDALGNDFDYKEFHSILLDNGEPPLFILEKLVKNWIALKQS